MALSSEHTLKIFTTSMTQQKLRPATITKRIEILERLAFYLHPAVLLDATLEQLREFQGTFAHLAPASSNVYTRHLRAFYLWAFDMEFLDANTAARLAVPRVPKAVPHPTRREDLRVMLKCAPEHLRTAYMLGAFAGLRCGEITRLRYEHLDLNTPIPTASVDGKGGKQRTVPLLEPVTDELRGRSRGWVIMRPDSSSWTPTALAIESTRFLHSMGIDSTLHGTRHFFATTVGELTHDPYLIRDLLGHESLKSGEIYTKTSLNGVQGRLNDFSSLISALLSNEAA